MLKLKMYLTKDDDVEPLTPSRLICGKRIHHLPDVTELTPEGNQLTYMSKL